MANQLPFGKYLLLERINVGGMAEVYKAKSMDVEGVYDILAIKRILPTMAEDEEFIHMFVDEARVAVQLKHPHIVSVYELGKFERQYYIAMEYVSGRDLRQILDQMRRLDQLLPIEIACYVGLKICEGLAYAHQKCDATGEWLRLIHRDVSPQNILLSYEGAVKITDFGIAKANNRISKTQAGVLKGKFAYMSPEQVRGMTIDARSDLFAVGILLYEMLVGKRLFLAESDFATLERVRNAQMPPIAEEAPHLPAELIAVLEKALAGDREQRYQDAAALQQALQRFTIKADNVYTSTDLAKWMQTLFQSNLLTERKKMEDYQQLRWPAAGGQLSKAVLPLPVPSASQDNPNEHTMIFESGFHEPKHMEFKTTSVPNTAEIAAKVQEEAPRPLKTSLLSAKQRQAATSLLRSGKGVLLLCLLLLGLIGAGLWWQRGGRVGSLQIGSEPAGASVVLDKKQTIGKTPLLAERIPIGLHELKLELAGFEVQQLTVAVTTNVVLPVNIQFKPLPGQQKGSLALQSNPPGATVLVNGIIQKGTTPLLLEGLDTREAYAITFRKPGYQEQIERFAFPAESFHQTLVATLQSEEASKYPEKWSLAIRSKPLGAEVYLDGTSRGQTPLQLPKHLLRSHSQLTLVLEGYKQYHLTLENHRLPQAVDAQLRREAQHVVPGGCTGQNGRLSVTTVGRADCRIVVGKMDLGVAPLFNRPAPIGRCPIEVICPDGQTLNPPPLLLRPFLEQRLIIRPEQWGEEAGQSKRANLPRERGKWRKKGPLAE